MSRAGDTYGVRYSWPVWWFGPQNHYGRFHGFGPQNLDEGYEEERATCGSIKEFGSKRSYLMKGAVAVGCRLSWVGQECPCD